MDALGAITVSVRAPARAERMIATARLVLAIFTFVAISLDPSEPAQYYGLTYSLLLAYKPLFPHPRRGLENDATKRPAARDPT